MSGWRDCRSWQRALTREPSPACETPEEMALFEIQSYLASSGCGRQVGIKTDPSMGESFSISESGSKILIHGGSRGVLYGAYALIEALELGEPLPAGGRSPFYPLRMIDCWDNMDGTIERGYAGLLDEEFHEMKSRDVSDIIQRGGTILYTARCMEFMTEEGQAEGADPAKRGNLI